MAITKSAKKALRQSKRRKVFNSKRARVLRDTVKNVRQLAKTGGEAALKELSLAYKAIDKAAKRGIIKKNTASRKKSQLARSLSPKK